MDGKNTGRPSSTLKLVTDILNQQTAESRPEVAFLKQSIQ